MMDNAITIMSNPANNIIICHKPSCTTEAKADSDIFISNINCGMMIGNPMIAINAACCCALAAMAAKKVKTRLKLIPPKQQIPINRNKYSNGSPSRIIKMERLSKLITSISKTLKMSLEMMKSLAPAIE